MESSFGEKLTELRESRGYSQYQLGKLLGVTDKAVSKWETGKARPRQTACTKLAALLGVDIEQLLDDDSLTKEESDSLLRKKKDQLWKACENRISEVYGPEPPLQVANRFILEKNALYRTHAVLFFDLLAKVREAARAKGARFLVPGQVHFSFAAWLMGATAINPLEAHAYCPKCHKAVFRRDLHSGWDLPPQNCECGAKMIRDGHDLPFDSIVDVTGDPYGFLDCGTDSSFFKEAETMMLRYGEELCTMEIWRDPPGTIQNINPFTGKLETVQTLASSVLMFYPKRKAVSRAPGKITGPVEIQNWGKNKGVPVIILGPCISDPAILGHTPESGAGPELLADRKVMVHALERYYRYIEDNAAIDPLGRILPDIRPWLEGLTFGQYISFICAAQNVYMVSGADELSAKLGIPLTEIPMSGTEIRYLINRCAEYPGYLSGTAGEIILKAHRGDYLGGVTNRDRAAFRQLNLPEWFADFVSQIVTLAARSDCLSLGIRLLAESRRELEEKKRRYG